MKGFPSKGQMNRHATRMARREWKREIKGGSGGNGGGDDEDEKIKAFLSVCGILIVFIIILGFLIGNAFFHGLLLLFGAGVLGIVLYLVVDKIGPKDEDKS